MLAEIVDVAVDDVVERVLVVLAGVADLALV